MRNLKEGPVFLAGDYLTYATVDGALESSRIANENVMNILGSTMLSF